jgi:hypothetical protein
LAQKEDIEVIKSMDEYKKKEETNEPYLTLMVEESKKISTIL